jgi:hypothetical protein
VDVAGGRHTTIEVPTYNDAVTPPDAGRPDAAPGADRWTGERPLVTGTPIVIGLVLLGIAVTALLLSLGSAAGPAAKLSQDYMDMMAGSLAPTIEGADAARLAHALGREGLGFVPRIVSLEPDFTLLGGRRHTFERRPAAAWFYRSGSMDSALSEAFEGRLAELGTPDEVRREAGATLHIFRKTTQTIACWQDARLVYVFISTLPSEVVIALARRLTAAEAASTP